MVHPLLKYMQPLPGIHTVCGMSLTRSLPGQFFPGCHPGYDLVFAEVPAMLCCRCTAELHLHKTALETEALALSAHEFGTVCREAYGHLTSATNILRRCWRHICFDKATALCDILYKRLRNILTYLLTKWRVYSSVALSGAHKLTRFVSGSEHVNTIKMVQRRAARFGFAKDDYRHTTSVEAECSWRGIYSKDIRTYIKFFVF